MAFAEIGYSGEIGGLYVSQSQQHRGIGRALMAAMADALAQRGHAGATLWVLRDNARARAFYERLGGVIVGEKADRNGDGAPAEIAYGWRDWSLLLS